MEEECSIQVLLMEHDTPEDFHKCVCQTSEGISLVYFMFEKLVDFYHLGLLVFYVILGANNLNNKYFIFFDFWTMCLMELSPGVFWYWFKAGRDIETMELDYTPWLYKFHWCIFSACLPASLLSCIVFWSLVYSKNAQVFSILLNTASPFLYTCQFLLAAFPLRLLHFYFFMIFYLIYIFFTLIYQKCGGTGVCGSVPIYSVLDWRHPGKAILYSLLGLAIGEALYLILCFISMGKLWIRNSYLYD